MLYCVVGDIDFIIFPPPDDYDEHTASHISCALPPCPNSPRIANNRKFVLLTDLIDSLVAVGFLTDHLSLPHDPWSGGDTIINGSPIKKQKIQDNNDDYISSRNDDMGDSDRAGDVRLDPLVYRGTYMGVCKLPENTPNVQLVRTNSGEERTVFRRIDIKVCSSTYTIFQLY